MNEKGILEIRKSDTIDEKGIAIVDGDIFWDGLRKTIMKKLWNNGIPA